MKLNERQAGHIEGYAAALQDIQLAMTGENFSAKRYDPATVRLEEGRISSYAYNLLTGGRGHPLSDFDSVEQVTSLMLQEVIQAFQEEQQCHAA